MTKPRRATRLLETPLALAVALAACSTPKPEAERLIDAVDRFHRASNDDRPYRADTLGKVECADPEVCAARNACVAAASQTGKALRIKKEVEEVIEQVKGKKLPPDDPKVRALTDRLDEASKLLEAGHSMMPVCDQKILVLRERYGL